MADETKKLFRARAEGDVKVLKDAYIANGNLMVLLDSLNGLKGNGFTIEVSGLAAQKPVQDTQGYTPPTVSRAITLRAPGKGDSSLAVTLDLAGVYRFEFEASSKGEMAASKYADTTVGNQAANRVQQWLVDVQSAFDINVLGTALARANERTQASKAAAEKRDPAAKPA